VPSQLYRTADGWIFVMCQTQRFWEVFCDKIGHPDLAADPNYRGYGERLARRDELTELLDRILMEKATAAWLEIFAGAVPVAPVHDLADALDSDFLAERGGVRTVPHPVRPDLKLVANPLRVGADMPDRPAPPLGADTAAILAELGYDADEIAALEAAAAI
jgi:crotonobetainyl-CoA:carnitine CoA-transferase CaiB-like acyl-CoA transferase